MVEATSEYNAKPSVCFIPTNPGNTLGVSTLGSKYYATVSGYLGTPDTPKFSTINIFKNSKICNATYPSRVTYDLDAQVLEVNSLLIVDTVNHPYILIGATVSSTYTDTNPEEEEGIPEGNENMQSESTYAIVLKWEFSSADQIPYTVWKSTIDNRFNKLLRMDTTVLFSITPPDNTTEAILYYVPLDDIAEANGSSPVVPNEFYFSDSQDPVNEGDCDDKIDVSYYRSLGIVRDFIVDDTNLYALLEKGDYDNNGRETVLTTLLYTPIADLGWMMGLIEYTNLTSFRKADVHLYVADNALYVVISSDQPSLSTMNNNISKFADNDLYAVEIANGAVVDANALVSALRQLSITFNIDDELDIATAIEEALLDATGYRSGFEKILDAAKKAANTAVNPTILPTTVVDAVIDAINTAAPAFIADTVAAQLGETNDLAILAAEAAKEVNATIYSVAKAVQTASNRITNNRVVTAVINAADTVVADLIDEAVKAKVAQVQLDQLDLIGSKEAQKREDAAAAAVAAKEAAALAAAAAAAALALAESEADTAVA